MNRLAPVWMCAAFGLAGCSVFFDPDDHLSAAGAIDAGDRDAAPRRDAAVADGSTAGDGGSGDGGDVDGGRGADAGRPLRCPAVASPERYCTGTTDWRTGPLVATGLGSPTGLTAAVVESLDGTALLIAGPFPTPQLYRYELGIDAPAVVGVIDVAAGITTAGARPPQNVTGMAAQRVGVGELALTLLADPAPAEGASPVYIASVTDDTVASAVNLTSGGVVTPHYPGVAVTGTEGSFGARHFWRYEPSGGGVSLASLPVDALGPTNFRSTQRDVDDAVEDRAIEGSNGDFVVTVGEDGRSLLLWSGLGASTEPEMANFVDAASSPVRYAVEGVVRDYDIAYVGGDDYVLALIVEAGGELSTTTVRATCRATCSQTEPTEVCANECTFGSESNLSQEAASSGLVAVAPAGVGLVTVTAAFSFGSTHSVMSWVTNGEVSDTNLARSFISDAPGVAIAVSAAGLVRGTTVDTATFWLAVEGGEVTLHGASFSPCLCAP